jgi:hypothetical protein
MGRPKKEEGHIRQMLMQVRLQEAELQAFREAAEASGLDLSSWVRERLRKAAQKESRDQSR